MKESLTISVIDASNYLKGLMLLIRKDHRVTESERSLIMRIGKSLGFDREFCELTINEILDNKHIEDLPPKFSEKKLAEKFIKDGLAVIFSDNIIHPAEEEWLIAAAERNDMDISAYYKLKKAYTAIDAGFEKLEAEDLNVKQ